MKAQWLINWYQFVWVCPHPSWIDWITGCHSSNKSPCSRGKKPKWLKETRVFWTHLVWIGMWIGKPGFWGGVIDFPVVKIKTWFLPKNLFFLTKRVPMAGLIWCPPWYGEVGDPKALPQTRADRTSRSFPFRIQVRFFWIIIQEITTLAFKYDIGSWLWYHDLWPTISLRVVLKRPNASWNERPWNGNPLTLINQN